MHSINALLVDITAQPIDEQNVPITSNTPASVDDITEDHSDIPAFLIVVVT